MQGFQNKPAPNTSHQLLQAFVLGNVVTKFIDAQVCFNNIFEGVSAKPR